MLMLFKTTVFQFSIPSNRLISGNFAGGDVIKTWSCKLVGRNL